MLYWCEDFIALNISFSSEIIHISEDFSNNICIHLFLSILGYGTSMKQLVFSLIVHQYTWYCLHTIVTCLHTILTKQHCCSSRERVPCHTPAEWVQPFRSYRRGFRVLDILSEFNNIAKELTQYGWHKWNLCLSW